jgi:alkanesulfonate monooxygenase SsuD/methylene tetrahydromethanopterin reductase-like flavin-dependent oxidoreductase (luciferase family)
MQFGIFDHLERRHDCDLTQQYEDRLRLMAQADEAGIYGYHIAEHHHSPLCLAPNQSVFLAAAAQRTQRLKIGTLVYVLPLYNPIRLIEEICLVDRLSNGRVQVGVGRGAGGGGAELELWGLDGTDSDGIFRESLEILIRGLQDEYLNFQGKHFRFEHLWMELRPVQQPLPAFWYAGNPTHAGDLGMNFIGSGPIGKVKASCAKYLDAWKRGQAEPTACTVKSTAPLYGATRHMFIADTDAEAKERGRVAYEAYRRHFRRPLPPGVERKVSPALAARLAEAAGGKTLGATDEKRQQFFGPASADPDMAIAGESLLVGSPSTIRDYVLRYAREADANYYVGAFSWGDLTHDESSKSLRLFAEEVMPAIT